MYAKQTSFDSTALNLPVAQGIHIYSLLPSEVIAATAASPFGGTNTEIKNKNLSCSLVRNDSISN